MKEKSSPVAMKVRILALLEEAGEENILTIANTIFESRYVANAIEKIRIALSDLLKIEFVGIATMVQDSSRLWQLVPVRDAFAELLDLEARVRWSAKETQWIWIGLPTMYVVLTDRGMEEAHKILTKHGWSSRGEIR